MIAEERREIQQRIERLGKIFMELSTELNELAAVLAHSELPLESKHHLPVAVNQNYYAASQAVFEKPRRRKRSSSLEDAHPQIAGMWYHERNGGVVPSQVARTSPKKYWWKCPDCAFEWEASVLTQVMRKYPCQNCAANQRAIGAQASVKPTVRRTTETLATLYPNIAGEWHPSLNGDLTPDRVSARSQERAWWVCTNCKQPFRARIGNRTIGTRCPECRHLTTG